MTHHLQGSQKDICLFIYLSSVRQLHREFLRAGANVMQTFTFYASDDKLENRGNQLGFTVGCWNNKKYIVDRKSIWILIVWDLMA